MGRRSGFTLIELITVLGIVAVILSLLLTAFNAAREAARRIQCMNNLKQIHLGLNSYHATHSCLPPGAVDSARPILENGLGHRIGWIGGLLPFAEQSSVYGSLNFDVVVEDSANSTAANCRISMLVCPDSYSSARPRPPLWPFAGLARGASPAVWESGLTSYVACHHDVEKAIDVNDHGVFFLNSRVRMADVADGLSQTIFVGEVVEPAAAGFLAGGRASLRNTGTPINGLDVAALGDLTTLDEWRASSQTPEALESLLKRGSVKIPPGYVGGFGSMHQGEGSIFAFGDGSVRFIRAKIDPAVFRRLGNRDDGEELDGNAY